MKLLRSIFTILCALWLTQAGADALLGSNLDGLLDYAREHNPELAASRHEADAAQQRTDSADALPDPVLRAEQMDITNRVAGQNLGMMTTQRYQLSQSLPWFGKRGLQRDIAAAQTSQANGQVAATWYDLTSRLRTAYALNYYLAASERLTQQTLDLLDSLEKIARERYANGSGAQQDVVRIQVETSTLLNALIELQDEHHHAHVQLNALLSRPASAMLSDPVQPRLLPPASHLDEEALQRRLREHNPQLQIADAQIQSAGKSRDLAYVNRYPGFTLGIARTQFNNSMNT